jgi:hypothetical protein
MQSHMAPMNASPNAGRNFFIHGPKLLQELDLLEILGKPDKSDCSAGAAIDTVWCPAYRARLTPPPLHGCCTRAAPV